MKGKRIMQTQKTNKSLIGAGIFAAIAASLCCITPVLALVAGISGFASAFSWLDPLRPYLIGITVLVLGFAWYQKLKLKKEIECDCEEDDQPSFWQSKRFLAIITVIAALYNTELIKENYLKVGNKLVAIRKESDGRIREMDILDHMIEVNSGRQGGEFLLTSS